MDTYCKNDEKDRENATLYMRRNLRQMYLSRFLEHKIIYKRGNIHICHHWLICECHRCTFRRVIVKLQWRKYVFLLCKVSNRHCRRPRKLFIARSNVISHEARESLSICVYSSLISRSFLCFRENAKALMFTGNRGSYLFSRATYIRAAKSLVVSLFTSIYFLLSSSQPLSNSRRMPEKASLLLLKWKLGLNDDTASKISVVMLIFINWWSILIKYSTRSIWKTKMMLKSRKYWKKIVKITEYLS